MNSSHRTFTLTSNTLWQTRAKKKHFVKMWTIYSTYVKVYDFSKKPNNNFHSHPVLVSLRLSVHPSDCTAEPRELKIDSHRHIWHSKEHRTCDTDLWGKIWYLTYTLWDWCTMRAANFSKQGLIEEKKSKQFLESLITKTVK